MHKLLRVSQADWSSPVLPWPQWWGICHSLPLPVALHPDGWLGDGHPPLSILKALQQHTQCRVAHWLGPDIYMVSPIQVTPKKFLRMDLIMAQGLE